MIGQKKKHSLAESLMNVAFGYGIALGTQVIVFPLFGIFIPIHESALIGVIFTAVSIVRSYFLRRLFNHLHITGVLK